MMSGRWSLIPGYFLLRMASSDFFLCRELWIDVISTCCVGIAPGRHSHGIKLVLINHVIVHLHLDDVTAATQALVNSIPKTVQKKTFLAALGVHSCDKRWQRTASSHEITFVERGKEAMYAFGTSTGSTDTGRFATR